MANNIELDQEAVQYDEGRAILDKSKHGFITWEELKRLPHQENNYLIDKFLWEGQVAMLLAREKVGKSILSKQMICALTSGEPFLDEYEVSRKCTVCYLQLEGDRGETKDRFLRMTKEVPIDGDNFFWRFFDHLKLDTEKDRDKLIREIHDIGKTPDVIFLDPVYMCISGSLSDDKTVSAMIANIRTIQEVFDCAIVLVHHEHKPIKNQDKKVIDEGDDSIMGSFAFKAFVSHVMRMTVKHPCKTRILKCDTQRSGGVETEVRLTLCGDPSDTNVPLLFKKQVGKLPKGAGEEIFKIIKGRSGGASQKVVISKGYPESTVRGCFGQLRKAGRIRRDRREATGEVFFVATKEVK